MVSKGRSAAYKQTHARILLLGDEAQEGGAMKVKTLPGPSRLAVRRWNAAAMERAAATEPPEAAGRQGEAHLIALACGEPPKGRASYAAIAGHWW